MNANYEFDYLNESDFRNKERTLRKINMLAYKKLTFMFYSDLRKGNFLGKEVSRNDKDKTICYELELPTDELFKKVHGTITLHYTVDNVKKTIILTNFTPEDIFSEGSHSDELVTFKGVMVSKKNPEKDMFKINLLKSLDK